MRKRPALLPSALIFVAFATLAACGSGGLAPIPVTATATATIPPATAPPATAPPATSPPATAAPATSPPATAAPVSISVNPGTLSFIATGAAQAQQFVATVTGTATLTESDTCAPASGVIATVTAASGGTFTVTPQAAGSCTITVTAGGKSANVTVGVTTTTGSAV